MLIVIIGTVKNQSFSWIPNRPPSKGAKAYHDAVSNTSWHKENIQGLIKIIKNKIKANDVIVDFGAGTGSSAIYLLKYLKNIKLMLVDNSASWLGYAHKILSRIKNVTFILLVKKEDRYMKLDETLGKIKADHIVSANTVHLIPDLQNTFKGIYGALKNNGTFTIQSGNIIKPTKKRGILMIDDSINAVHDIALEIIRSDTKFSKYRKNLAKRISEQIFQRKFVFPVPRPVQHYLSMLKSAGFKNEKVTYKLIKVKFNDWLKFLRVRRLQAGILPEIGGKDATIQEERDRDIIITRAALKLFKKLIEQNTHSNTKLFTAEWTYIHAKK